MVIYILNLAFLESRVRDLIYYRDQCKIILKHYRRSVIIHYEWWMMRQGSALAHRVTARGARRHII